MLPAASWLPESHPDRASGARPRVRPTVGAVRAEMESGAPAECVRHVVDLEVEGSVEDVDELLARVLHWFGSAVGPRFDDCHGPGHEEPTVRTGQAHELEARLGGEDGLALGGPDVHRLAPLH